MLKAALFAGLAATRNPEAIPLLQKKVVYGATSNRSRPAAVFALADIGKGQEKRVREALVEQLEDLLRDRWIWTPWAAAYGLRKMKAAAAIDALEAFGKPLSVQEQAEIDRLIASLRQQDKTDGSAVKKQVEDLQKRVRKLDEKLQKLSARMEVKSEE